MDPKDCPRREWLVFNAWFNPLPIVDYPCVCGTHGERQMTLDEAVVSTMSDSYKMDKYGVAVPKGM